MGDFRIVIHAVGGHGDGREVGHGGALELGMLPGNSVDRVAFEAVEALKSRGCQVKEATIIHWPGTSSQVFDDVLNAKRYGSFGG